MVYRMLFTGFGINRFVKVAAWRAMLFINFRIFSKCFFKVFLGIEVVGIFALVAVVDHIGAVIQLINAFFQGSIKIERIEFLLA